MRFIAFASRYSYYFIGIIILTLPTVSLAYSVDGDGCFERESGIIRLTEPTCSLTLTSTENETVELSFENVDPDSVEISSSDVTLITERTQTSLATSFILTGTARVTIEPWFEPDEDNLWFVALSDNQAAGTVETNPIFEDMLPMISAINPVFMTNAGDLIQGNDDDDTARDMFTAVLETLEETTVPMFPTPGNHDHNSDLSIYESYFGNVDYSYAYGPAQLIALSTSGTSSRGTVTTEQLDWLTTELTGTDTPILVYFHHPLSVPSWGKSTCCFADTTERDALAATLEQGGVDQVINGHSQGYDWRWLTSTDVSSLTDGLYQLVSGGGGGNISQPDGDYHFTLVHVTPDEITHQVFELEETDIVVDENKAGDEVTVEYDGVADLPYVRLKFRVDATTPHYLIASETGEYLEYQSHTFDDITVLFAETNLSPGTATFTARPAQTMHTGSSQTFDTAGYATFTSIPTSTDSDTGIAVTPHKLSTMISDVAATDSGFTWVEQPERRSVDTTYTLTNLPDQAAVEVYLNDTLMSRGRSDSTGSYSFTATKNANARRFTVVWQSDLTKIMTVPTDGGTAHVREFTLSGKNTNNFFSADGRTGRFRVQYAFITDDTAPNLLVTDLEQHRLYVHDDSGDVVGKLYVTGEVYTNNNRIYLGQKQSIRTYRWSTTKEEFIPVQRWLSDGQLIDWVVVDNKIIALTKNKNRYQLINDSVTKRLRSDFVPMQLTVCQCDNSSTSSLVVVAQNNHHIRLSTYDIDLVKLHFKTMRIEDDIEQVITGHMTDRSLDTIGIVGNDKLYLFQAKASGKFKRLPNISAIDQAGIVQDRLVVTTTARPTQVQVYDYNDLLDEFELDDFFSPYGETFLGGVTLAVP